MGPLIESLSTLRVVLFLLQPLQTHVKLRFLAMIRLSSHHAGERSRAAPEGRVSRRGRQACGSHSLGVLARRGEGLLLEHAACANGRSTASTPGGGGAP